MKLRNPTHRAPARPQPNLHHDGGPRAAARLGFKATHIIVTGKAAARSRRHRSRARGEGAQWGRLVSFVLGAQPARGARLGETAKRVSQRGYPTKVASREKIGHQAATGRNSGGQFASPRRVAAERSALEWLSLCSRATSSRRVGPLVDCRYDLTDESGTAVLTWVVPGCASDSLAPAIPKERTDLLSFLCVGY